MQNNDSFKKPYRWIVLIVFIGVAALSQMLWLNFAPLISFLQEKYGVSEMEVSMLLLAFPLLYVFLSLHSGSLIDRKGYKYAIGFGSIISALFSLVRIYDSSFYALLIGQLGIAIGQPYIINGVSKLVADWFSKEEGALATGLGTCGMLIGMAIGMGLTPVLTENIGFQNAMIVFAAISIVCTLAFILLAKENQRALPNTTTNGSLHDFKILLQNKNLLILYVISFLALGFFNGLTTWLEPMLKPNGINAEQAGMVGAYVILGGILGSIIIPAISDKAKRRKPFLIFSCVFAIAILYPLCTIKSLNTVYLLSALMGFFFLPGYAIVLSMCEEMVGIQKAGSATGILMLAGNLGAVAVIIAMPLANGNSQNWMNSIYLMLALLAVALLLSAGPLKESS
jgi:sugar phosphate permease